MVGAQDTHTHKHRDKYISSIIIQINNFEPLNCDCIANIHFDFY